MSSVVASADSGKPPPTALPIVTMSGITPVWSMPHHVPVRPKPVIISSAMNSAPTSCAIDFIAGRNSFGGTMLPAVPCIGSTITPATAPAVATLTYLRATSAHASPQLG